MHSDEGRTKQAVVAAGIMLGVSGLGCLIYLPILMKSLIGLRKVFIILQQVCTVGFLLTQMLSYVIMNEADYWYTYSALTDNHMQITLAELYWRRELSSVFQSFFLYLQYFLSFMLSWDIYKMIHDPLSYAEFCTKSNISKYLGAGVIVSFALVLENVIEIIAVPMIITDPKRFVFGRPQQMQFLSLSNVLDKYSLVKFIITKVIYSGVIIKIAAKTKAALQQSTELNSDTGKVRLYKRLFLFTLIPLGINFWYLFPECLDEIWPLYKIDISDTDRNFFSRKDTRTYIHSIMATLASFTYFVAFPLLFPTIKASIKATFMCGIKEKQRVGHRAHDLSSYSDK